MNADVCLAAGSACVGYFFTGRGPGMRLYVVAKAVEAPPLVSFGGKKKFEVDVALKAEKQVLLVHEADIGMRDFL